MESRRRYRRNEQSGVRSLYAYTAQYLSCEEVRPGFPRQTLLRETHELRGATETADGDEATDQISLLCDALCERESA